MSNRRRGFSPEFKTEAVKMVIESSKTVNEVAREIQIGSETLRSWVNKYKAEHAEDEPPLTVSERARLKELERENRELRQKCDFLGKCSAFFAREYR
jgi:transposase